MQISSPITASKTSIYNEPHSLHDACFLPSSNYLHPSTTNIPCSAVCATYQQSFCQILTGNLQKKTLNSRWQSRFFVLTPFRLLYFSDEQRTQLKGCFSLISLKQHHLKITLAFPQLAFTVTFVYQNQVVSKTILMLQILEEKEFNHWSLVLAKVLENLEGPNQNLYPQLKVESLMQSNQKIGKSNCNFWNSITISKAELMSYVSHMDIIFLRSKSTFSNVHRFLMRSQYDHVGILLKDEAERAYLLQAIHQKGVTISRLDNLLQSFHQEYEDIAYRKLFTLNNKFLPLEKLQGYVNHLIGKKYELSITKILIDNQTDYVDSGDQSNEQPRTKHEKTYFCSQLVADIYLKFGVLIQGKSNHYWPKDFQQTNLPISSGFYLSPLMKVDIPTIEDLDRSIFQE